MCVYVYVYNMYVCVYSYICMYVWVYVYVLYYVSVCVYVYVCVCISSCVYDCVLQWSRSIWWDLNPLQEIWICTHYGPDTLAIRTPIHGMIQRSVAVRAVKIRWQFESKITSFHVSVYSIIISLFIVISRCLYVTRIISYERLSDFTSMITYITSWDIKKRSPYLFSWYEHLSVSFHVIVGCHYWTKTSYGIQ